MDYQLLIDETYFTDNLEIVHQDQYDIDAIRKFAAMYEVDFLRQLLGDPLYATVYNELKGDVDLSHRIESIAYGKRFIFNPVNSCCGYYNEPFNENVIYNGLLQTPDSSLGPLAFIASVYNAKSPIANYVYCKWLDNKWTQTTAVGETVQSQTNAIVVSARDKYVRAWNELVDMVRTFYMFIDTHIEDYPEFDLIECEKRLRIVKLSPYFNFLMDKPY